jgi:hypothetical protein
MLRRIIPCTPVTGGVAIMRAPSRHGGSTGAADHSVDLPYPEELQKLLQENHLVESFLGQGGMGAVYQGLQLPLRRPVAIKILPRGLGADYAFEERFKREAYAMAALTHSHIVQVYDCGNAGEQFLFISMEYVEGGDLSAALKAGQVTPQMALNILPGICDGLQAAHERGILHRDIKPANIFLTADGRAKLADFGLAKRIDRSATMLTRSGLGGLGTPDYAAPEQYENLPDIDQRADVYSLGVMMYQLLTGHLPRGAWKAPSTCAGTDPRLDAVVLKAMEPEREDRYQHVADLKADILRIITHPSHERASSSHLTAVPKAVQIAPPATGPMVLARPVTTPVARTRVASGPVPQRPRPAMMAPMRPAITTPVTAPYTGPIARKHRWTATFITTLVCATVMAAGAWALLNPSTPQVRKVELLNLEDLRGAPLSGVWTPQETGLHCTAPPGRQAVRNDNHMRLYELHYAPPTEYDFEIEFTRKSGSILHIVSGEGCTFVHELRPAREDGTPARSGFVGVDGKWLDQATEGYALISAPPADGHRHVATVQVRRGEVRSLLDGKEIVHWKEIPRLALPHHLRLGGSSGHLGIASRGGEVIFHRATVREISGEGSHTTPDATLANKGKPPKAVTTR